MLWQASARPDNLPDLTGTCGRRAPPGRRLANHCGIDCCFPHEPKGRLWPASHTTEQIRNIAMVGHAGSGKTTLIEALLKQAGAIRRRGLHRQGHHGVRFHRSREAAGAFAGHGGHAPGARRPPHPSAGQPGLSRLHGPRPSARCPPAETAAVVVSAQAGIELLTQRMMESAAENNLCRLIIVNKIDAPDADLAGVLAAIVETFGRGCLPVNLPANGRHDRRRLLLRARRFDARFLVRRGSPYADCRPGRGTGRRPHDDVPGRRGNLAGTAPRPLRAGAQARAT